MEVDTVLENKFWPKVEKLPNGCWQWRGSIGKKGYGTISIKNKNKVAHRWAYKILVRDLSDEEQLDHLCRNRSCVNPEHLEPVSQYVNVMRGIGPSAQNKRKTHCDYGHEFTDENIYYQNGVERSCRECIKTRTVVTTEIQSKRITEAKGRGFIMAVNLLQEEGFDSAANYLIDYQKKVSQS